MRSAKSILFLILLTDSSSYSIRLWQIRKIFKKYNSTLASCMLYFSCHMLQFNYIRWNNWRRRISNWQIGRNLNYSRELISYYMRCNVGPVNVMVNAEFTNHCNERRCFAALRNNLVRKQTIMARDWWVEESHEKSSGTDFILRQFFYDYINNYSLAIISSNYNKL